MSNFTADANQEGIIWGRLDDCEAETDDFIDAFNAQYNELIRSFVSITSTAGVCSGGTVTANPGGAAYTIRVSATFGVNGLGQVLYMSSQQDKVITASDAGKYIVLQRTETESNPDGRYNEFTGDSTNYVRTITVEPAVVDATSAIGATTSYIILGTLVAVSATGGLTINNTGRQEWSPHTYEASIPTTDVNIDTFDDEYDITQTPTNLKEVIDKIYTLFNYVFNGGSLTTGGHDNVTSNVTVNVPTNVTSSTGMDYDLKYNDINIHSSEHNTRAYAELSLTAPGSGVTPHFYEFKLVPVTKVAGIDQALSQIPVYSTENRNNISDTTSTATSIFIPNLTPGMKVTPYARACYRNWTGIARSSWVAGTSFVLGGGSTGVTQPLGAVLTVTGAKRYFDLSWTAISNALRYAIYAREGAQPDETDKRYLEKVVEGTSFKLPWEYTENTVYFKIVPINATDIYASWNMSGSGTMNTTDDQPTTSSHLSILGGMGGSLSGGQSISLTDLYTAQERITSIDEWMFNLGVTTMSDAMKFYGREEDTRLVPIIWVNQAPTPGASAYTEDLGLWIADEDWYINRIYCCVSKNTDKFADDMELYVYIDGVKTITLLCEDDDVESNWIGAEDLVNGNKITLQIRATTGTGNNVTGFLEVARDYHR